MKSQNIILVGVTNGKARQYIQTLKNLGHNVQTIQSHAVETYSIYEKIRYKIRLPIDKNNLNQKLLKSIKDKSINIIIDFKSLVLRKSTIEKIRQISPSIKIIFFSEDDMSRNHNNSIYFLNAIKNYDCVFVSNQKHLAETMLRLGAKKSYFQYKSFDETLCEKITLNKSEFDKYKSDVTFVGTFEKQRAQIMFRLAKKGIKIVVWGNGWSSWKNKHTNLIVKDMPIYGNEWVKVINASKINLNFLRKINNDLHTSRSVDIPACAAFMLAERTTEHMDLFIEGKEAEFFGDEKELETKIMFYLKNDKKRNDIAQQAYNKCRSSDYSHSKKIKEIINLINKL